MTLRPWIAKHFGAESAYGHLAAQSVAAAIRDYEREAAR